MSRAFITLPLSVMIASLALAETPAAPVTPGSEAAVTAAPTGPTPKPYAIFVGENSPMEARFFIDVAPGYSAINSHQKITRGATVMRDERRHNDFAGAEVALGYAFDVTEFGHHELRLGTGVIIRQQHLNIDVPGAYVKTDEIDTIIPITFGYRYQFAVGKNTSVHLGAFGGAAIFGYGIDANGYGAADNQSDYDVTWQAGVGVGVRHWFTRRFGMDIGYDFRAMGSTAHDLTIFGNTYHTRYTDVRAHTVKLGFLFAF